MSNKMINCKTCGQEISASAKVCPGCGAKNKKPIYKKWWFYVAIVVVIAIIGGSAGNGDSDSMAVKTESSKKASTSSVTSSKEEIAYTSYDVTTLFDEIDANALKAQKAHKGEYVEIHACLSGIDSEGSYISVGANSNNYDYFLKTIHCTIKNSNKDEILDKVINMNTDDEITVKGKITDVGEFLGYSMTVDSIE